MSYFLPILLQISVGNGAQPVEIQTDAPATDAGLSVMELLWKGGPVMIPILLLSIIALALFIERLIYISKAGKLDSRLFEEVKRQLNTGDVTGALKICAGNPLPVARLLEKGLIRLGSPIRDIESGIETTARVEVYKMEKNLNILSAIAAIAPMFGFLGTVIGMIRAFYNISISDNISIGIIASGIYEKMITSASGLIVGVLAYIFYTYLNTMIDRAVHRLEITAIDFLDLLHKPVE